MSLLFKTANSDSVRVGTNVSSLTNVAGVTLMGWVKLNSVPPIGASPADKYTPLAVSIGNATVTSQSRAELEIQNTGPLPKISIVMRALNGDAGDVYSSDSATGNSQISPFLIAGTVYHLAVTFDYITRIANLYINGLIAKGPSAVQTSSTSGNTSATNSFNAELGSEEDPTGGEFMDGFIEDQRVYSRVLGPDEIQTVYNCMGVDGIVLGLKQRYCLDDSAPGVAASASSPPDHGVLGLNGSVISGSPVYAPSLATTFRRRLP
jgi:hypothetical protein